MTSPVVPVETSAARYSRQHTETTAAQGPWSIRNDVGSSRTTMYRQNVVPFKISELHPMGLSSVLFIKVCAGLESLHLRIGGNTLKSISQ